MTRNFSLFRVCALSSLSSLHTRTLLNYAAVPGGITGCWASLSSLLKDPRTACPRRCFLETLFPKQEGLSLPSRSGHPHELCILPEPEERPPLPADPGGGAREEAAPRVSGLRADHRPAVCWLLFLTNSMYHAHSSSSGTEAASCPGCPSSCQEHRWLRGIPVEIPSENFQLRQVHVEPDWTHPWIVKRCRRYVHYGRRCPKAPCRHCRMSQQAADKAAIVPCCKRHSSRPAPLTPRLPLAPSFTCTASFTCPHECSTRLRKSCVKNQL